MTRATRNLRIWLFFGLALLYASPAMAIGIILPRDESLGPLSIKYHRVTATIKNGTAVTSVKQSFQNNTHRILEGTFYFPLPEGATISDFALYMNGKRISGSVLERGQARQIYESIVRRMRDPGLIEYINHKLFKARIYPIPASGEMKVDIAFTQVLPFNDGVYLYEYPMRTSHQALKTLKDFTLVTRIESSIPLKTIYSPSHKIFVRKKGDHNATASFEEQHVAFTKDFTLYIAVSKKSIGLNLLTYKPKGEAGYFVLMASPKSKLREKEIIGKGIVFVLDTSGSMSGEKMTRAKAALKYCLNKLNKKDYFNIVRFSSDVESFEKQLVPASSSNISKALKFVDQTEAAGATAFHEALVASLKQLAKSDRPNIVMFLTDGQPTIGETRSSEIIADAKKQNSVKASIFFFGVGDDINTHLLDRIAEEHRGFSTYLKPNQDIELKIASFYNKISYPVMSDISLDFGSVKTYSMVPNRVPDLFKGSQIILYGRYRNAGHTAVTLRGKVGGETKTFTFDGVFAAENDKNEFIAKLWAYRQVGYLLDTIRLKGESYELKREVIQLAKRFGIVTPYTSYLVVEPNTTVTRNRWRRPMEQRRIFFRGRDGTLSQPTNRPAPELGGRGLNKLDDLKKETGRTGIKVSKKLALMRHRQTLSPSDDQGRRTRYVAGKQFDYKNGSWTDSRYSSSMATLKIKYLSRAYFNLLTAAPKLKRFLQLGDRVIIVVGRVAVVISDNGASDLSISSIRSKLGR
ncbi:MAG: VWA domain-containing protein [Myxococcales bacterium]|nr:VWA domain-containing protein [Myxococcales bacterium]